MEREEDFLVENEIGYHRRPEISRRCGVQSSVSMHISWVSRRGMQVCEGGRPRRKRRTIGNDGRAVLRGRVMLGSVRSFATMLTTEGWAQEEDGEN